MSRESSTKCPISADELEALVRASLGTAVAAWRPLAGGTYNAAYLVTLDSGRETVLKVAPPPTLRLLSHEVDLMRTEVDFYRRADAAGVPVPSVLHAGFERALLDRDYVFLSRVPGLGLDAAQKEMSAAQLSAVRRELAAITARLHTVTGTRYGYPLRSSRSWQPTWRAAFTAMLGDALADVQRLGHTDLPMPLARITELVERHAGLLDEVTRPALVHFDLWDGNVFVTRSSTGAWRVSGLIDGERAFFGDPAAELVCLALLKDVADVPEIIDGYPGMRLTEHVSRRITIYTVYLYLLMCIEGRTRGWDGDPEHEAFRHHVLGLLDRLLTRL